MEKLNRGSSGAARQTRKPGQGMKGTLWPRQIQVQPRCRHHQSGNRYRQPDQLMIWFVRSQSPPAKLHQISSMMTGQGTQHAKHHREQETAAAADN